MSSERDFVPQEEAEERYPLWKSVVGVLAVIAILAVAGYLTYGLWGPSAARRAAGAFLAALERGDLEGARRYLAPNAQTSNDARLQAVSRGKRSFRTTTVDVTADAYAMVKYRAQSDSKPVEGLLALSKEDNRWVVHAMDQEMFMADFALSQEDRREAANEAERVAREFVQALLAGDTERALAQMTEAAQNAGRAMAEQETAHWAKHKEAKFRALEYLFGHSPPIENDLSAPDGTVVEVEFHISSPDNPMRGNTPAEGPTGLVVSSAPAGGGGPPGGSARGGGGPGRPGGQGSRSGSGQEGPPPAKAAPPPAPKVTATSPFTEYVVMVKEKGRWRVRGARVVPNYPSGNVAAVRRDYEKGTTEPLTQGRGGQAGQTGGQSRPR